MQEYNWKKTFYKVLIQTQGEARFSEPNTLLKKIHPALLTPVWLMTNKQVFVLFTR